MDDDLFPLTDHQQAVLQALFDAGRPTPVSELARTAAIGGNFASSRALVSRTLKELRKGALCDYMQQGRQHLYYATVDKASIGAAQTQSLLRAQVTTRGLQPMLETILRQTLGMLSQPPNSSHKSPDSLCDVSCDD